MLQPHQARPLRGGGRRLYEAEAAATCRASGVTVRHVFCLLRFLPPPERGARDGSPAPAWPPSLAAVLPPIVPPLASAAQAEQVRLARAVTEAQAAAQQDAEEEDGKQASTAAAAAAAATA